MECEEMMPPREPPQFDDDPTEDEISGARIDPGFKQKAT